MRSIARRAACHHNRTHVLFCQGGYGSFDQLRIDEGRAAPAGDQGRPPLRRQGRTSPTTPALRSRSRSCAGAGEAGNVSATRSKSVFDELGRCRTPRAGTPAATSAERGGKPSLRSRPGFRPLLRPSTSWSERGNRFAARSYRARDGRCRSGRWPAASTWSPAGLEMAPAKEPSLAHRRQARKMRSPARGPSRVRR